MLVERDSPLLETLHVEGFRTLIDATLRPGRFCALVGEANAGKSNLLAAIRSVLDPEAAPLTPSDAALGGDGRIRIRGRLADGMELIVGSGAGLAARGSRLPTVLFLPAGLRSGPVITAPGSSPEAARAAAILSDLIPDPLARGEPGTSTTEAAQCLVTGLEACRAEGVTRLVILIEEPELFLPPQTGRYLYRLLRGLAASGNQVIYSTHSPAFLNVSRLEELVLTERHPGRGTLLTQPEALEPDVGFRALTEFDAERSELFLARSVVLVEGMTEKLVLPFVFRALGFDADHDRISVVECGGKSKMPLFARICRATGVPFMAVHDRDAPEGAEPNPGEAYLNDLILRTAGAERTVVLVPDFESVAGLRGERDKVARAWRHFREVPPGEMPGPLVEVVERAVELAGG
jgi:hypothetical protein